MPNARHPVFTFRRRRAFALLSVAAVVGGGVAAGPSSATNRGTPGLVAVETQACATPRVCLPTTRRPIALDPATRAVTRLDAAGTRLREPQFSPDGTRLIGINARSGEITATDATGANPQTTFAGSTWKARSVTWGLYGLPAFTTTDGDLWMANYEDGTRIERNYFSDLGPFERVTGSWVSDDLSLVTTTTTPSAFSPSRGAIIPWAQGIPSVGVFGAGPATLPAGVTETMTDVTVDGDTGLAVLLRTRRTATGAYRTSLLTVDPFTPDGDDGLPQSRTVLRRDSRTGPAITSASLSPDGKRIAFLADGDLDTVNLDGTDVQTLLDPPGRRVVGRISWQTTDPTPDAARVPLAAG